jgi:hypothetical protein
MGKVNTKKKTVNNTVPYPLLNLPSPGQDKKGVSNDDEGSPNNDKGNKDNGKLCNNRSPGNEVTVTMGFTSN